MARIDLDLAHAYRPNPQSDSDYALLPLTMSFRDGGAYALLGPSGCGKTTMLNIMSGLVAPSQGSVKFDGVDMTAASPQQRNIAQVFQFPVIYDTMTVAENLAFPLRNRKVPQAQINKRVGEIAEMLEMSGQLNQRASGLAADAKQKISLGRGLVRPDVSAVLFDEPLTVIDPHLKWQLRRKLKQIHHELKLTLIYVTHDQVEALTFAEEVVVMTRGRAVQVGSADALFERPSHTFVGHFHWLARHELPARGTGRCRADYSGQHAELPVGSNVPEGPLKLGIRPEYLALAQAGGVGALPLTVVMVQDVGTHIMLTAASVSTRSRRVCARRRRAAHGRAGLAAGAGRRTPVFTSMTSWWRMSTTTKPVNQKAWFLILPVIICVAFSAILPLMTVVNYSVQDIISPERRVFVGTEWFAAVMRDEELHAALWRQLTFSLAVLAVEIPLGIALALSMPAQGWKASLVLVVVALSLLIPWNVVGTIWQIYGRADIGLMGARCRSWASTTATPATPPTPGSPCC